MNQISGRRHTGMLLTMRNIIYYIYILFFHPFVTEAARIFSSIVNYNIFCNIIFIYSRHGKYPGIRTRVRMPNAEVAFFIIYLM